jgi:hypothetical protein
MIWLTSFLVQMQKAYNKEGFISIQLVLSKLAQAVMLLTCIQEVPGCNFGPDTDCPDQGLLWYSSVPPGEFH